MSCRTVDSARSSLDFYILSRARLAARFSCLDFLPALVCSGCAFVLPQSLPHVLRSDPLPPPPILIPVGAVPRAAFGAAALLLAALDVFLLVRAAPPANHVYDFAARAAVLRPRALGLRRLA